MGKLIAEKVRDEYIKLINKETGEVEVVLKSPYLDVEKNRDKFFEMEQEIDGEIKTILVQKSIDTAQLDLSSTKTRYNPIIADMIAERLTEGETLRDICKDPHMPSYRIVCKWRREIDEFGETLEYARRDRAEMLHDMAIKEAENSLDKDTLGNDKLRVETYKWAAEKGDPDKFGNKTKISGDAKAPLGIIIETGIRRDGDDGFNVDECLAAREVTPGEAALDGSKSSKIEDVSDNIDGEPSEDK